MSLNTRKGGLPKGLVLVLFVLVFMAFSSGNDKPSLVRAAVESSFQADIAFGNLVINSVSTGGNQDDDLTVRFDGSHIYISISEKKTLSAGEVTMIHGDGTGTLAVPVALIWGPQVILNGGEGDDVLTVDFGDHQTPFSKEIVFNGQGQNYADTLVLTGEGPVNEVIFGYLNEHDGVVQVAPNQRITYTGLEPITSQITAVNVNLTYSPEAETITVTDAGGGNTQVDSTMGEWTTFNNPTSMLTINAGDTGNDVIVIDSLAPSYPAGVTIDGQGGMDVINLNGSLSTAGKDIHLAAETVAVWGTLGPGAASGTFNLDGNLSFGDSSTFEVEIGGTIPGTDHDQLNLTGTVAIGSSVTLTANAYGGYTPAGGEEFVIINNDDMEAVTGTFTGLPEGAAINNFLGSGHTALISYVGGDGNDVVLTITSPEIDVQRPVSNSIPDGGTDPQGTKETAQKVTLTYTVANMGSAGLYVSHISATANSNVTVDPITKTNFMVAPGGTNTFDVSYTPLTPGDFEFDLAITSDDADENPYDIRVSGTSVMPYQYYFPLVMK